MTSNPLLILLINMTVVFFVLFMLELLTRGIYFIDPTRKKTTPAEVETPVVESVSTTEESVEDLALVAVIAAAIAAMGETNGCIKVIKRFDGTSWSRMGRINAVNTRKQMY